MKGLATASSSFNYQWTYDVFINFRGEDTRHGFTGNLYNSLNQKGVHTFLDDEELRRGDEITPTLLEAIENSRMAITVFSKNYASSTFCLNELVKIYELIKMKGRLVLPIFYDVNPSEVRYQKENYEQALSMHIRNRRADQQMIESWKVALHEVSNISGFHFNPGHSYEYQFIEKIVKEIYNKINRVLLHVATYPVGLESRVLAINSLLQIGSANKVIMIGICGIGGMGKTTISRALYNSVADNFEDMCFYHDIKEDSRRLGLERIQEAILSKIVGEDIKVQDFNEGVEVMKMRLKQKKVLLVLDNINKHEQLEKLAGNCSWFRGGSRIIITTRNRHLLLRHGIKSIYNMEAFNYEESLELLNWIAYRNHQVNPSYINVLNCAITYAQGLPLALEVIGSNLCGKPTNEWESALDTYKLIPNRDIQKVLMVSYEGLEQVEKEIFLDIACFFNGKRLEYVKYMVEVVHGFNNLSYFIGVLVDKCLIKIVNYDCRIEMHDLIQDMGREIVREESPKKPGKRSRLWFHQDIVDVLEDNSGTDKVRMIIQDNLSKCIEVNWDGEAFKSMKGLKILIFENVKFWESPKYLPNSLKVLKWKGYSSSYLPPNFCPKKLVMLDIGYSCLSSLETIIKTSNNLSIVNLQGCRYVTEIPDLSNLVNLKELNLKYCKNLTEIHDSIGFLPKLEILDLEDCVQLNTFPHGIKLPSLKELDLNGCSSLKYFPEILEKVKITELYLCRTGIEKLPSSICNLSELKNIWIIDQTKLLITEIPHDIFLLPELECIVINNGKVIISSNSKEVQQQQIWPKGCPDKVLLSLRRCNISDDVLTTYLNRFINVTHMDLRGNNFTIVPLWIKQCLSLVRLKLNECKNLREVEGIPPNIRHLEATNCTSLSLESKSLLLSEEFHGHPSKYNHYLEEEVTYFFCVPCISLPDWFEHKNKGAFISFWFCNSFPPALCLCVLFKPKDGVLYSDDPNPPYFISRVSINGEEACSLCLPSFDDALKQFDGHHLVVYHLTKYHISHYEIEEPEWIHVEVAVHAYSSFQQIPDDCVIIEESGVHVIKQLSELKDISFTNPYQTFDSITAEQEIYDGDGDGDDITEISNEQDDDVVVVGTNSKCTYNDGNGALLLKNMIIFPC